MSDLELAVGMSRKLERMLKDGLGAEGKGLGQQAISVKHKLPPHTFDDLMRVAGIRNRVVHEGEPIHSPERFTTTCASIAEDLKRVYALTNPPRLDVSSQKRVSGVNPELLRMVVAEPASVRPILNAPLDPDAERAKSQRRGPSKAPEPEQPTFRGLTLPSRSGEPSMLKLRQETEGLQTGEALPAIHVVSAETVPPGVLVKKGHPVAPAQATLAGSVGATKTPPKATPVRVPRRTPVPVFIPDSEPILVQSWTIPAPPSVQPVPSPSAPSKVNRQPAEGAPQDATAKSVVAKKRASSRKPKVPSAIILSIVEEHRVVEEALLGMLIHLEFTIQNLKDANCQATAYFTSRRGEALVDFNDEYCTEDGHVCVWEDFVPQFNDAHLSEFTLFMPYDELHLESGVHELCFAIGLHCVDTRLQIASSKVQNFAIRY